LERHSEQESFIALAAPWVTVPARTCSRLDLVYGQTISIIEVKPLQPHTRHPFRLEGDKVDMLSLIPATSMNGYQLYVDEFDTNGEPWLRVWYHHPRGAARQIELRRYVDISKLGQLLGQLQAEGDKKYPRVVFKNASISEHQDFVSALREVGVPKTLVLARCVWNPTKSFQESVRNYADSYTEMTDVVVSSLNENTAMKGALVAETSVRSSILASILNSAMDEARRGAIQDQRLQHAFLAKLLAGDGTLDARRTPRRLDVRLKIVDQNLEHLSDYAAILAKEGFIAHVLFDQIAVRAYCTWPNLLTLYQISAFRRTRNWTKLICSIIIQVKGAENQGYKRIQELSRLKTITSADVASKYSIGLRSANLWIGTMMRRGLMEAIPKEGGGYKNYKVSAAGMQIAKILGEIESEYAKICMEQGTDDAEIILQRSKRKPNRALTNSNHLKGGIGPSAAE